MSPRESSWPDRIRDLIEEVDRVRHESERMRSHAERAMKSPFWPERRREPRFPSNDAGHYEHRNDA